MLTGRVSDIFKYFLPQVLPSPDYQHLMPAMKRQCVLLNLQPDPYFLMKVGTDS